LEQGVNCQFTLGFRLGYPKLGLISGTKTRTWIIIIIIIFKNQTNTGQNFKMC
jgi:hypothetical protein